MAFNIGGKAPKKMPAATERPSYVLGSRPEQLRAPMVPNIKPGPASTTQYGKPRSNKPTSGVGFGPSLGGSYGV